MRTLILVVLACLIAVPAGAVEGWRFACDTDDATNMRAVYLERHGDTAPIFAAMEADALLDAGDLDGAATWRRVVKAIHELTGTEGTRH